MAIDPVPQSSAVVLNLWLLILQPVRSTPRDEDSTLSFAFVANGGEPLVPQNMRSKNLLHSGYSYLR